MSLIELGRLWSGMIAFSGLVLLTGCKTQTTSLTEKITKPRIEMPQQCAGWEKINIKNSARYYLLASDQRLVINIDAHNLRGRNLGCWQ